MKEDRRTRAQLIDELSTLRQRLSSIGDRSRVDSRRALRPSPPRNPRLYGDFTSLRLNDHVAFIYESEDDWCCATASFILLGLKLGRKVVWISNSHQSLENCECLHSLGIDVSEEEATDKVLIHDGDDLWRRDGEVDFDRAFCLIEETSRKMTGEDDVAFHLIEEMPAFRTKAGCDDLLEYEARLNRDIFSRYPCIGLCLYDRWRSSAQAIKNAIMTHPMLVRNGSVYRNFYYVPPEEFLVDGRDEREVQEMLASIEEEGEIQNRVRFLSRVLELSSQSFCSTYLDGSVMHCNLAFSSLTGYSQRELRAMKWMRDLTPPEWREEQANALERLRYTGNAQLYERELVRKDGARVPVEIFVHQMRDETGEPVYYYTFINDISERKNHQGRTTG
jgi:PAS domain S-box-containing protein